MADEQKEYKRARARVTTALEKLHEAKGYLDAKTIYKNDVTPAIEALLAAKLDVLREAKTQPQAIAADCNKRNRLRR